MILSLTLMAGVGLSFSPATAFTARAEEGAEAETTTAINFTGQLIELSNTSVPTVIVVRQNPTGEFTDYTVDITTETKFGFLGREKTSMEDWMSGDHVKIIGEKNENTGVVEAQYAINLSINPLLHRGLNGWLTAIDSEAGTVTVQWMDVEHVVNVTDSTRLVVPPNTEAALIDFKVGDRVRLRLLKDGTVENEARFMVALRRGSELFLKARTRPFHAEVNSIIVNDDGSGSLEVTLGNNPHLVPGDVNNLFGVEGDVKTVTFDANTKFVRRYNGTTEANEIMVGDQLLIVGRYNDDGTVSARLIKDTNIWMLGVSLHEGEVLSIDTATNTIVIKANSFRGEDKEVTVTYLDEVIIIENEIVVSENEITVGDKIRVRGEARRSDGELVGIEDVSKIRLSVE